MDEHIRNLERLASSGNYVTLQRLLRELFRSHNYQHLAEVLSDNEELIPDSSPENPNSHWIRNYRLGLRRACRLFSVYSTNFNRALRIAETIVARLEEANGARRTRLLDEDDIARMLIFAQRNPHRFSDVTGGGVVAAYKYPAWTSGALAFRPPRSRSIYMDITVCPAMAVSMGRCWHELQPWHSEIGRSSTIEQVRTQRLELWAQDSDRIRIPNYLVQIVVDMMREIHEHDDLSRLEDPEELFTTILGIVFP